MTEENKVSVEIKSPFFILNSKYKYHKREQEKLFEQMKDEIVPFLYLYEINISLGSITNLDIVRTENGNFVEIIYEYYYCQEWCSKYAEIPVSVIQAENPKEEKERLDREAKSLFEQKQKEKKDKEKEIKEALELETYKRLSKKFGSNSAS